MEREIWEIVKALDNKKLTAITANVTSIADGGALNHRS